MPSAIIHQATAATSWRILSLLRLGERRIYIIKRTMDMTESAFSHALRKLEEAGLVTVRKVGREKQATLSEQGRIVFSNIQALCFMLGGTDGTSVEDDSALVRQLRVLPHEPLG
jgi:DNA-binding transcriptional ArsR family regulator